MRKFLIVDADPIFYELAVEYFGKGNTEILWTDRIDLAHEILSSGGIDVAFISLSLGGDPEVGLIQLCRKMAHTLDMPVFALISGLNRQKLLEGLQLGASSFAVKPVNWPLLECQIDYVSLQCQQTAILRNRSRSQEEH